MKKLALLLFFFPLVLFSQTANNRLDKAKALIRQEFKENMNDYASYSPVSYSSLDSLFTSPFEDESINRTLERTIKAQIKAGAENLEITDDVTPIIEAIEKEPELYKEGALDNCKVYAAYQKILLSELKNFVPEFIGWKLTHKYRAKNTYNATILHEFEFRFDKGMTKILSYTPTE